MSSPEDYYNDPGKMKVSYYDDDDEKWENVGEYELDFEQKRQHLISMKIPTCRTTEMKFEFSPKNLHQW